MRRYRILLFYIVTILFFGFSCYLVVRAGHGLEQGKLWSPHPSDRVGDQAIRSYGQSLKQPMVLLLLQIVIIMLTARCVGFLFRKIGQPAVMGEIIAGLLLGPTVLGRFFPKLFNGLFPATGMGNLQVLSQIGLVLFMFVVGLELDLDVIKTKAREALVISHASIIFPFFLGLLLALYLYREFAPAGISFLSFALFSGISMSITAFPVLARIVQERGLAKTRLGTLALTCAAIDDITAWCLLAMVIALVKAGTVFSAVMTISLSLLYIVVMLKMVRPLLVRSAVNGLKKSLLVACLIVLLASACLTELIGIHALFGAFLAGAVMPNDPVFRKQLSGRLEDLALLVLLPLFFVFTGLRTQVGLLNNVHLWLIFALVMLVAVTGKFAGSALAARFTGQSWPQSLAIGALMNTRGLMELIVLNIGYDLGVLSQQYFVMLVLMAILTTMLTGPVLNGLHGFRTAGSPINQK